MSGDGLFGRLSDQIESSEAAVDSTPFTMSELLDLPDLDMRIARVVLRSETALTIDEIADRLEEDREVVASAVGALNLRGVLDVTEGVVKMGSVRRTSRIGPGGVFGRLADL